VLHDIFLQQNQRDSLISQIYFWNRTLHVSDSFSVHQQESSTVHTAIGVCHRGYADCLLASSQHNLYDIYLSLCVQCLTPDDGQRNCPKHVQFYPKNKSEKLLHLVGFTIRIFRSNLGLKEMMRYLITASLCSDTNRSAKQVIF